MKAFFCFAFGAVAVGLDWRWTLCLDLSSELFLSHNFPLTLFIHAFFESLQSLVFTVSTRPQVDLNKLHYLSRGWLKLRLLNLVAELGYWSFQICCSLMKNVEKLGLLNLILIMLCPVTERCLYWMFIGCYLRKHLFHFCRKMELFPVCTAMEKATGQFRKACACASRATAQIQPWRLVEVSWRVLQVLACGQRKTVVGNVPACDLMWPRVGVLCLTKVGLPQIGH